MSCFFFLISSLLALCFCVSPFGHLLFSSFLFPFSPLFFFLQLYFSIFLFSICSFVHFCFSSFYFSFFVVKYFLFLISLLSRFFQHRFWPCSLAPRAVFTITAVFAIISAVISWTIRVSSACWCASHGHGTRTPSFPPHEVVRLEPIAEIGTNRTPPAAWHSLQENER